ncbi:hypothetical protein AncyloWKF20_19265 [Ancylobacter sp. WKF20]|uniref:hypothetical protein n=1 Tax=Ancylobacter sp. WKF20 TaxID=3039801 RepID=UPI00243414F0|nr:hypothetical protein [Ancylobacter sp. WKF20]WGD29866.1 hypothetical protein AncyloWKF20_19265 [Ancylobacter sp. WKF20]
MFDIAAGWMARLGSAIIPDKSKEPGWIVDSQVDQAFVEPTLKILQGDPTTARILIIAAPGAVGKSTYARSIGARANAVLVDLAQTEPLGGNFFVGGIANAFGYEALADVANGRIALVVDALDEAQLRSGSEGFSAGLLDLCKIVQNSSALPATLLGRAAAAEEAWLILSEAGLDPCLLQIDYFDEEQSKQVIRRRLPVIADTRDAMRTAFGKHEEKFVELALATREKLTSTPSGNEQRFAGYAPVLDAICTYALGEGDLNPSTRLSNLAAESAINLIVQIATSILEREQTKLTSQIEPPPAGIDLSSLYTPDEQLRRIAAILLGSDAPAGLSISDAAFRQVYEGMVAEFTPQHPFLDPRGGPSNAAFAAYLLVWAITTGSAKPDARRMLASNPTFGSGLFFEMYMSWLGRSAENLLALEDVGSLYGSFASQAAQGERPTLDVSAEPGDATADVEFEMTPPADSSVDVGRSYGPYTSAIDGILEFKGPVGGLRIMAPVSVIIGDGRTASITSPVEIDVEGFEIDARELRVFKSTVGDDVGLGRVTLEALDASVGRVERIFLHGAQLQATFPGARAHPWADYAVNKQVAPNPRIASLRRRARKVLTSFRSHSKGAMVRLAAKIEHARMMKEGQDGPQLLQRLRDDGILTTFDAGKFYVLHPDKLAQHFNMDYQALHLQRWTDEADAYLSSIGG